MFIPRGPSRPERILYQRDFNTNEPALSFQTVAELWKLAEGSGWGESRRRDLANFIDRFIVIPYDPELGHTWARIAVAAERAGRRMEDGDLWIAATAGRHSIPLITHGRDFVGRSIAGLNVVSRLS